MRTIDLTHPISEDIQVYPGDTAPRIEPSATHEKNGYAALSLSMTSHSGTHIDAPYHVIPCGRKLSELPPSAFLGTACVIDCRRIPEGGEITPELINANPSAKSVDFLIFNTGYAELWASEKYKLSYPTLSRAAANMIADRAYKGVGFDTFGPDRVGSIEMHKILLARDMIIIENLAAASECGEGEFDLIAMPMSIACSDGAPARVIAIIDREK